MRRFFTKNSGLHGKINTPYFSSCSSLLLTLQKTNVTLQIIHHPKNDKPIPLIFMRIFILTCGSILPILQTEAPVA
ncbi:hypothetical protein GT23_0848 [Parageobacillus thermoglucosidasius]|nr:hypothetical protein GT23_0848 [Parageobacillus thermoglucosidasius]